MRDEFCLGAKSACLKNFQFFGITSAVEKDLSIPGIVGLAPIPGHFNFLDKLVKQQLMSKRLFTLKLTGDLTKSEFTFGYIDSDFIRMPDEEHKFVGNS